MLLLKVFLVCLADAGSIDQALDELQIVLSYVQTHMLEQIRDALSDNASTTTPLDYRALHHALMYSKNTTIDALVQLQQRLSAAAIQQQMNDILDSTHPEECPPHPTTSLPYINSLNAVLHSSSTVDDELNVHPAFRRRSGQAEAPVPAQPLMPNFSQTSPTTPIWWTANEAVSRPQPSTATATNPDMIVTTTWSRSGARMRNVLRRTRPFRSSSQASQQVIEDAMTPVSPVDSVICWPSVEQADAERDRAVQNMNAGPMRDSLDNEFEDVDGEASPPPLPPRPIRSQTHERTISSASEASEASQVSTTFSHTSNVSMSSDRTSLSSMHSVISIPLIPKRSPLRVVNDISSTVLKRLSMYSVQDIPSPLQPHTQHRLNIHAGELPRETNDFRGLCKSAWYLQTGQVKAALKESKNRDSFISIPGLDLGVGNVSRHRWVCRAPGCDFDGPVAVSEDGEGAAVLDPMVLSRSPRVMFRWSFLFKSHLPHPSSDVERLRWYGCVFCHARVDCEDETGVYLGEEALMGHIEEMHVGEGKWPEREVCQRMGCVVGRPGMLGAGEECDIWLPDHYRGCESGSGSGSEGGGGESGRSSLSAVAGSGVCREEEAGGCMRAVRRKPVGQLRVVT